MIGCPSSSPYFKSKQYCWPSLTACGPNSSSQAKAACADGDELASSKPSKLNHSIQQEKLASNLSKTIIPATSFLAKPSFLPAPIDTYSRPGRAVEGDWKTHPLASAVEKFIIETVAMTTDPLALAGIEWSDDGATMANRFVRHGLKNLRR